MSLDCKKRKEVHRMKDGCGSYIRLNSQQHAGSATCQSGYTLIKMWTFRIATERDGLCYLMTFGEYRNNTFKVGTFFSMRKLQRKTKSRYGMTNIIQNYIKPNKLYMNECDRISWGEQVVSCCDLLFLWNVDNHCHPMDKMLMCSPVLSVFAFCPS